MAILSRYWIDSYFMFGVCMEFLVCKLLKRASIHNEGGKRRKFSIVKHNIHLFGLIVIDLIEGFSRCFIKKSYPILTAVCTMKQTADSCLLQYYNEKAVYSTIIIIETRQEGIVYLSKRLKFSGNAHHIQVSFTI